MHRVGSAFARFFGELAVQDWMVLAYLHALLAFVVAGQGPRRALAIGYLLVDIAVFTGALVLMRGRREDGARAALAYRAGLVVALVGTFVQLPYILPVARPVTVDAQVHAFDLAVFGFEPAQALDPFVTVGRTEWFAFFYFGYFALVAAHVVGFMLAGRRMDLVAEFSLGIVIVFCVGHLLYIAVPGRGPYHHLADSFRHALAGPTWWPLVTRTVESGEPAARTDIFPSLHTAAPTFFAIFAARHRANAPFRYLWAPLAFVASQIVVSTMYLRWHYIVDVVAGVALALAAAVVAKRVTARESRRREGLGKTPVWTPLVPGSLAEDAGRQLDT